MEYRRLGRSGLKVSVIGLGSWLTYGAAVEPPRAMACVRRAHELGVNFFDTANVYNRGEAETLVGEALSVFPRESYALATKVFFPMGDGPNESGLSRKHIMEQCHASLRRLGLDYLDLYQCHRFDAGTPLEETLRALDDLVTQGKILYAGVSQWTAAQITDAVGLAARLNLDRIVSNQPRYSLIDRGIEAEIMPVCAEAGIGQVVYSPLAQGILTGKYRPGQPLPLGSRAADERQNRFLTGLLANEGMLTRVERFVELARENGVPPSRLALAWVLRRPEVVSAIVGASRPEQVEENVCAAGLVLTDDILAAIERIFSG